jgi:hypothetical protein
LTPNTHENSGCTSGSFIPNTYQSENYILPKTDKKFEELKSDSKSENGGESCTSESDSSILNGSDVYDWPPNPYGRERPIKYVGYLISDNRILLEYEKQYTVEFELQSLACNPPIVEQVYCYVRFVENGTWYTEEMLLNDYVNKFLKSDDIKFVIDDFEKLKKVDEHSYRSWVIVEKILQVLDNVRSQHRGKHIELLKTFDKFVEIKSESGIPTGNELSPVEQSHYYDRSVNRKRMESVNVEGRMMNPVPKVDGIPNPKNNCYINAAVQCLVRIPPLTTFMLSPEFDQHLNPRNCGVACAYRDLVKNICTDECPDVGSAVARLKSMVAVKHERFAGWDEQDSQEFLEAVLDDLREGLNRGSSPIPAIFQVHLLTETDCPRCGVIATVPESFEFFRLPRAKSLDDALDSVREPNVDDDSRCSYCGNLVEKRTGVHRCGPVLMIHIPHDDDGLMEYPDVLNAAVFSADGNGGEYRLTGVMLYHKKQKKNSGHYTAMVLDESSGKWYDCNDSKVKEISVEEVHRHSPYMLFYVKDEKLTQVERLEWIEDEKPEFEKVMEEIRRSAFERARGTSKYDQVRK